MTIINKISSLDKDVKNIKVMTYEEFVENIESRKINPNDVDILYEPLLHGGLFEYMSYSNSGATEEELELAKKKIIYLIHSPLVDINGLDINDDTPLHVTCLSTSLTWAFEEILTARNKDVNILLRNDGNNTIIDCIEFKKDIDKLNILNKHLGVDIEAWNNAKHHNKGVKTNADLADDEKEKQTYLDHNIFRLKGIFADITNLAMTEYLNK